MRRMLLLFPALLLFAATGCHRHETTLSADLGAPWKFNPGDDTARAAAGFNDSAWTAILPTKPWEYQGFRKLDGFAWYRTRVVIPATLKEQGFVKDSLMFLLGRIDDCDQVYLNGQLIGENGVTLAPGSAPSADFTKVQGIWNTDRRYLLAVSDPRILWDRENVIAIRVFDQDGLGGLFSGPWEVRMPELADFVRFELTDTGYIFAGDTVGKRFLLVNRSASHDFSGVLNIRVCAGDNGNLLYGKDTLATLPRGTSPGYGFTVPGGLNRAATALLTFTEGASGSSVSTTLELPYLQTPPPPKTPRINGAKVFGVRPWAPFLFKVAATGEAPLRYFAYGLPETLKINEETGVITGYIDTKGTYEVRVCVENHLGHAERGLRIEAGDLISLTPPLGWNSWNCWGLSVSDEKVRQSADRIKSSGLIDHGWTYVNIDDGWEDTHVDSVIRPNGKFPDMKGMCDYIHAMGLKVGIYSSPGTLTCGGYEGSYGFEFRDAKSYADWGIDYLKYDWCSYGRIAPDPSLPEMKHPYKVMKRALHAVHRDIHYSLCQYGMGEVWTWGAEVDGNSWRTTGDITDTWESMSGIGFSQDKCSPYAAPGHWNDPDMLVIGWVGWGPELRYTGLTPNEQYTHITLWSMLASPLLIGCDLGRLDPFTLNLLTNDEVLAVNQDPLGRQAVRFQANEMWQIWTKEMEDSSLVVGVFNLTEEPLYVPVRADELGAKGVQHMRDLWTQRCLGKIKGHFDVKVPPHGARMLSLRP